MYCVVVTGMKIYTKVPLTEEERGGDEDEMGEEL